MGEVFDRASTVKIYNTHPALAVCSAGAVKATNLSHYLPGAAGCAVPLSQICSADGLGESIGGWACDRVKTGSSLHYRCHLSLRQPGSSKDFLLQAGSVLEQVCAVSRRP